MKHAALAIRALEKVKNNADQIMAKEFEKKLLDQNMELWLQRALGEDTDDN